MSPRTGWTAALVVMALLLAGCQADDGPPDPTGTQTETTTPPPSDDCPPQAIAETDAYGFAQQLVGPDDLPRYRIPGTVGHRQAGCWLWQAAHAPEWSMAFQNFTGADYSELDHGAVRGFSAGCNAADAERLESLSFSNVVASWHADRERVVLLGAHWDSKRFASEDDEHDDLPVLGANDGASGVGVLLALQRALAEAGPQDFGIIIAFFDGEDGFEDCHPLAGSVYYARTMAAGSVDRMILLDMVGDPEARFPRESRSVQTDPGLVDLIWDTAAARGLEANFVDTVRGVLDDHVPFTEEGVPAVDIIDYDRPQTFFPPYWHTAGDTMANLDAAFMDDIEALLLAVLADPAFVSGWPPA